MNNAQKEEIYGRSLPENEKKERKTDRRTLYTRRVIMDAYIQLLKDNPKEKIRVSEICRLAEINRCTFYLHFEDVSAVEDAIEKELADKFKNYLETQSKDNPLRQSLSGKFMEALLHDETYVTLMTSSRQSMPLSDLVEEFYSSQMKPALSGDQHLTERQQQLLYTFIVGGVVAVEQDWIKSKSKKIEQENLFLDRIVRLLINGL